mmetsp:Transcript_8204/g.21152  ORF Transcript_8204/g.21152 Transcript_8204/m.21152 type:complete len:240 (+) Transcript_8204:103-822(+)
MVAASGRRAVPRRDRVWRLASRSRRRVEVEAHDDGRLLRAFVGVPSIGLVHRLGVPVVAPGARGRRARNRVQQRLGARVQQRPRRRAEGAVAVACRIRLPRRPQEVPRRPQEEWRQRLHALEHGLAEDGEVLLCGLWGLEEQLHLHVRQSPDPKILLLLGPRAEAVPVDSEDGAEGAGPTADGHAGGQMDHLHLLLAALVDVHGESRVLPTAVSLQLAEAEQEAVLLPCLEQIARHDPH